MEKTMNLQKTDVFSGIGVFIIQLVINVIIYAIKKNNTYLVFGIILAVIITIFAISIIVLLRKIKQNEKKYNENYDKWNEEKAELADEVDGQGIRISDLENELDTIEQEVERTEQGLDLLEKKCEYYMNTGVINRKLLYSLKNKRRRENLELQALIAEIEYIFRDDTSSKKAIMNTSVFLENDEGNFFILVSTKHSPGTVDKLRLNKESLVGTAFSEKRTIYCGDIANRKPDMPFVELDRGRRYQSILAIPLIVDDYTELVLVITCTKTNCLEDTYNKYQDVIQRYLELLCVLIYISSNKEELR